MGSGLQNDFRMRTRTTIFKEVVGLVFEGNKMTVQERPGQKRYLFLHKKEGTSLYPYRHNVVICVVNHRIKLEDETAGSVRRRIHSGWFLFGGGGDFWSKFQECFRKAHSPRHNDTRFMNSLVSRSLPPLFLSFGKSPA